MQSAEQYDCSFFVTVDFSIECRAGVSALLSRAAPPIRFQSGAQQKIGQQRPRTILAIIQSLHLTTNTAPANQHYRRLC